MDKDSPFSKETDERHRLLNQFRAYMETPEHGPGAALGCLNARVMLIEERSDRNTDITNGNFRKMGAQLRRLEEGHPHLMLSSAAYAAQSVLSIVLRVAALVAAAYCIYYLWKARKGEIE